MSRDRTGEDLKIRAFFSTSHLYLTFTRMKETWKLTGIKLQHLPLKFKCFENGKCFSLSTQESPELTNGNQALGRDEKTSTIDAAFWVPFAVQCLTASTGVVSCDVFHVWGMSLKPTDATASEVRFQHGPIPKASIEVSSWSTWLTGKARRIKINGVL